MLIRGGNKNGNKGNVVDFQQPETNSENLLNLTEAKKLSVVVSLTSSFSFHGSSLGHQLRELLFNCRLWHRIITITIKTIDMERDNQSNPTENNNPDRYVDEITREKIRKHISDPNDKITEQDIENVNTDIFKRPEEELSDEALKGDNADKSESTEDDEITPKAPSTWNILED